MGVITSLEPGGITIRFSSVKKRNLTTGEKGENEFKFIIFGTVLFDGEVAGQVPSLASLGPGCSSFSPLC